MNLQIKSFDELQESPMYKEQLCRTSYETLVIAYNQLPDVFKEKNIKMDMSFYGGYEGKHIHGSSCGSVGCLIGWIATLFPIKNQYYSGANYSTSNFQEDRIPLLCETRFGSINNITMWYFLFSSTWVRYQNTIDLGLERILIVLSGNYNHTWKYTQNNKMS